MLEAAREYWTKLQGADKGRVSLSCMSPLTKYMVHSEQTGLFEETTAYDPSSPYSASKAASDHLATFPGAQNVWDACSNFELLKQLRALSIPGKAHPTDDAECPGEGKSLPVYGDGIECSRLALC